MGGGGPEGLRLGAVVYGIVQDSRCKTPMPDKQMSWHTVPRDSSSLPISLIRRESPI